MENNKKSARIQVKFKDLVKILRFEQDREKNELSLVSTHI